MDKDRTVFLFSNYFWWNFSRRNICYSFSYIWSRWPEYWKRCYCTTGNA